MRKIICVLLLLLLSCIFTFTCCSGNDDDKNEQETIDWSDTTKTTLIGLIEIGKDKKVCIITNWESKSRISYYVYGEFEKELEQNVGKYAKVTGLVKNGVNDPNPWSNKLLVEEIIEISDKPIIANETQNLFEWDKAKPEKIFGLVEISDKHINIIEDWESRSRKSYTVYGDFKDEINKYDGKYIFVKGKVLRHEDNPFSNEILVTEMFVISDKPLPDWSETKEDTINGKIELCQDNMPCVIKDWESKSRVSYYVYGKHRKTIENNIDKYAKVKGLVAKEESESNITWTRHIVVEEIIEISDKPID